MTPSSPPSQPSRRSVQVISFAEAPTVQIGSNTLRALATPQQGSEQFEVWTAAHAPHACTHFHFHESDEVLIFLKGRGEIRTKTESIPFEAPCTVILPGHTLHQVCNHTDAPTEAFGIIAADSAIFNQDGTPSAWRRAYLAEAQTEKP